MQSLLTASTTVIACVGLFWTGVVVGYYTRAIRRTIKGMKHQIKSRPVKEEPVAESPKSSLIDPNDPVQAAQFQMNEQIRKLNE